MTSPTHLQPLNELDPELFLKTKTLADFKLIQNLLEDSTVNEVIIFGYQRIFFERQSTLSKLESTFESERELRIFLNTLLSEIEQTADTRHPIADGVLKDGSRVNIILPPAAKEISICIRKHTSSNISLSQLESGETLSTEGGRILNTWIHEKANFLICGGTGSGKTTLMRALLRHVPHNQRIVTLEDTPELNIYQDNVASLFTRVDPNQLAPPISLSSLVRNSLRMRPDRIVIGEVRGEEALYLLDAISTGHPGSMCTIHANSCAHALRRLESLVSRAAPQWNPKTIRQLIFDSVTGVVFIEKKENKRIVSEISRISGLEEFGFLLEPLL